MFKHRQIRWERLEDRCLLANTIPGLIEAEDFSAQSGVIVEATSDMGGGDNVGFIQNGDNATYQIDPIGTGAYAATFRVASGGAGGNIRLSLGGVELASAAIANTGGWQSWTEVSTGEFLVDSDLEQPLLLSFEGPTGFLFNVNWMRFDSLGAEALSTRGRAPSCG